MEAGVHGWRLKKKVKTVFPDTEIALFQNLVGIEDTVLDKVMKTTVQVCKYIHTYRHNKLRG